MRELPAITTSSRTEMLSALADLAREMLGGMHPDDAKDVEDWIARAEAHLTSRSTAVVRAEAVARSRSAEPQRCSKCGRGGHKKTTCPEPDPIVRAIADTLPIIKVT